MKNLLFVLLAALSISACTSISEERVGDAEKLYWPEGVDDPNKVAHYGSSAAAPYDHEKVVKLYGSVAPIYGQDGFVNLIKKRAAKWGCNAILEIQRGSAKQTTYVTSVYVGAYAAYASTTPITVYIPYGTFYGIRTRGWLPPVEEDEEDNQQ